ncbi:hypothetical protein PFISCL1PPCAC_24571, partial [Pristionchus fissidentatus]
SKQWQQALMSANADCLKKVLELIEMQREQISLLREIVRRAEMGIPELPETMEQHSLYSSMSEQWLAVLKQVKNIDEMYTGRRNRNILRETFSMEVHIEEKRREVIRLMGEATELQNEVKKLNGNIELSIGIMKEISEKAPAA